MNWKSLLNPGFLVAMTLMLVSALGMSAAIRAYGLHLQKLEIYAPNNRQVSTLPRETPSWIQVGTDQIMDQDTVKTLGTKNYVSRVYMEKVDKSAQPAREPIVMELHVAYYTGGIDTVPHVPERCMVGGGWLQTQGAQTLPLALDSSTWVRDAGASSEARGDVYTVRTLPAPYSDAPGTRVPLPFGVSPQSPVRMRISAFGNPQTGKTLYSGYFFIANGGTVASAEGVRTLAFDLTSDYAYYLKVQCSSTSVASAEELATASSSLTSELIAEIMRCVPDWSLVEAGEYPADNPRRAERASRE
ncbi:MAG: exosortase-associated EpsI family protein [Leptolyngbya sp. PLA3]|nr:MAG: exosortase-associated EpsI family protein [Cyanobacteria bacterium CYA]MCE7969513.1 exosortase-associated EpsI family protein [Leptolyngbya sp. PL-A3]